MGTKVNNQGLSRHIPPAVKRAVRQRDGYGCVVCGSAIFDYEHFDPEFVDAREHSVDGIILLCDTCHRKKGRFLSRETIAAAAQNPCCKRNGFSWEQFDIGLKPPEVVVGTFRGTNVRVLIQIKGEDVLSILSPEEPGTPFRINATLRDREGKIILNIVENQWRPSTLNWDVEVVGATITLRKASRDIALVLRSEPPHRIVVERLDMEHRGTRITAKEGHNIVVETEYMRLESGGMSVDECDVGISVDETGLALGSGGGMINFESVVITPSERTLDFFMRPESVVAPLIQPASDAPYGRVSRNTPCPCGSGKKFKHCHGTLI